jgi:hypothetical protein
MARPKAEASDWSFSVEKLHVALVCGVAFLPTSAGWLKTGFSRPG